MARLMFVWMLSLSPETLFLEARGRQNRRAFPIHIVSPHHPPPRLAQPAQIHLSSIMVRIRRDDMRKAPKSMKSCAASNGSDVDTKIEISEGFFSIRSAHIHLHFFFHTLSLSLCVCGSGWRKYRVWKKNSPAQHFLLPEKKCDGAEWRARMAFVVCACAWSLCVRFFAARDKKFLRERYRHHR